MATTIIQKLIPWITPLIFFISCQIALDHGILGLVGFSIIGAVSFFIIYFYQKGQTFQQLDRWLHIFIYSLYTIELLTCLLMVGKMFALLFINNIPYYTIFSLITIVAVILIFLRVNQEGQAITTVILGLIFSFLIPTLVYLNVSIPTVYSGLHFLANEMLRFDSRETWILLVNIGIILIAHQFLHHYFSPNGKTKEKIGPTIISALIWMVVPISLGSIAFLAKAEAIWPEQSDHICILVIQQFGGHFGQVLFLMTNILILIGQGVRMWGNVRSSESQRFPLIALLYTFVPVVIVTFFKITLLDVLLYFGLLWGPLTGVFLWTSANQLLNRFVLGAGFIVSVVTAILYSLELGIIAGSVFSCLTMMVINKYSRKKLMKAAA
ncbi:hypothetical protein [Bacillus rubiinfantis]|uniref:hypothetical protein n=1 Tax=Bacillus rubiinfantis TaxID=1499680 RepID=UPI0005AA2CDC|nr:hypothetical protein [Bacillus rubiinfantis]